jgi:hypothetical protein
VSRPDPASDSYQDYTGGVYRPIFNIHSSLETTGGFSAGCVREDRPEATLTGLAVNRTREVLSRRRGWLSRHHIVAIVVCAITLRFSLQLEAGWSSAMLQPVMDIPAAWRVGPELACLTRPPIYYPRHWQWQRSNYSKYDILFLATHTTSTRPTSWTSSSRVREGDRA